MTFRDAQTGQPVMVTADRRVAQMGVFGRESKDHLRESFDDIARDLAKFLVRLSRGEAPRGIAAMRTIHVQHAGALGILSGMTAPSASLPPAPYVARFRSAVLPALRRLRGHRGMMVFRRSQDGLIRITVLTLWTSMSPVAELAGADTGAAVVEPAARDVLADFDARVEHFEPALHAEP